MSNPRRTTKPKTPMSKDQQLRRALAKIDELERKLEAFATLIDEHERKLRAKLDIEDFTALWVHEHAIHRATKLATRQANKAKKAARK